MRKIAVARLWHEGNSFAPTTVGMPEFEAREWLRGDEVTELLSGTATEPGGALDWVARSPSYELVFSRFASAAPGGPIEQSVVNQFLEEVLYDPCFDDADGIYLSLHGASIGTEDLAPEERLVLGLRKRFPSRPIVASFDMHCCPTEALASALNGATIYRTYPHIDMHEAAVGALDLLAGMIETGARHKVLRSTIGRILPSHNMRTAPGLPMTEIEDIAQAAQTAEGVLAAYPFASFAYADIPGADAGCLVTCDNSAAGQAVADKVCAAMQERRCRFRPTLRTAKEILGEAPWKGGTRVVVVEPSDNPLSGGGADTPGLLTAAVEADLPEGTVFAFFHDPDLVARAAEAGIGAAIEAKIGARHTLDFGAAVEMRLEVVRLTDGSFTNEGPMERGRRVTLGPSALFRAGGLRLIATSVCVAPNDVNYFRLHGIELDEVPLLLAKAKNHFMAALGSHFDIVIQADTPGPAQADATRLPFQFIPPERLSLD